MLKKNFVISLIIMLVLIDFTYPQSDTASLIFDGPYNHELPRNFRKSNGVFKYLSVTMPDTAGLNNLNISGSAEFNNLNLTLIIKTIIAPNITVIDLRQEMHGFINGMAISWYGKYDWADLNLTRDEIIKIEYNKLDSIHKLGGATVTYVLRKNKADDTFKKIRDTTFKVISVMTEEELTKANDLAYLRITVTDHRQPTIDDVDRFINFVKNLKGNNWLHFHCHAGDGRTTTFMAMFDMMKNAKQVAFTDIIQRQHLIGGIDLSKDDDFPSWDKQYAIERTSFLQDFYNYCKQNKDNFSTSYADWLKR